VKAPFHPATFVQDILKINARKSYFKLTILLKLFPNNILVVPEVSLYSGKVW
jgi:hypothetical protein